VGHPARSADSGGVTTVSAVVQIDTQVGPAGVSSPALSRASSSLSVVSCRQPSGHSAGSTPEARSAMVVPWCGAPRVSTRRACSAPPSAAQSRAITPPAE
jgi:hypothetical protein